MKKRNMYFVLAILAFASFAFTQNAPIDFEEGGYGADWTWTVFENDTNPPVEIIANPDASGANTSGTVAKFTALQTGQPWAGFESQHGADIGTYVLDETNSTIKIMVHKPVISDVGIKLISDTGWAQPEIKIPNTVVDQWEELTFDFSNYPNPPAEEGMYDQIVIFPDFNLDGRTQDNICYIDNITFNPETGGNEDEPEVAAPTPTMAAENVISLFSNQYTNVNVDTWSAEWDEAILQDIQIAGNDTKLYTNLVYAGIEFTSETIDASEMTHFHIDIWTPDDTAAPAVLKIKLVDFGADGVYDGGDDVEHELTFDENTLSSEQWVSLDIPLADFENLVTTGHLAQMIISGDPNTLYVDNVYFYNNVISADLNQTVKPQSYLLHNYPNPFNPTTNISYTIAEPGLVEIKIFNLKGQLVDVLSEGNKQANSHQVFWEAEKQASGIYFYNLNLNGKSVDTKSMILMK